MAGLSQEIRTFNEKIEEGGDLSLMRDEVSAANRIGFLGLPLSSTEHGAIKGNASGTRLYGPYLCHR